MSPTAASPKQPAKKRAANTTKLAQGQTSSKTPSKTTPAKTRITRPDRKPAPKTGATKKKPTRATTPSRKTTTGKTPTKAKTATTLPRAKASGKTPVKTRTTTSKKKPTTAAATRQPTIRARKRTLSTVLALTADLALFVALTAGLYYLWQNWWTNLVAENTRNDIINSLEWAPPPVPDTAPPVLIPTEDDPPIVPDPLEEDTFALLYIPDLGPDYIHPINEGVDRVTVLDTKGIGHYPKTALPGDVGNFAIAGHRTTHGKPFANIDQLEPGDPIIVRTENGWYIYRVKTTVIVWPTDVNVIYPIPEGLPGTWTEDRYIALTTCHPKGSAAKRLVVIGVLDYWSNDTASYPEEILDQLAQEGT